MPNSAIMAENMNKRTAKLTDYLTISVIIFLLMTCSACSKNKRSIQTFYFPDTEKVMIYNSWNKSTDEYWHIEQKAPNEIQTDIYNASFELEQSAVEELSDFGARQKALRLFQKDSLGQAIEQVVEIIHPDIMSFTNFDSNLVYVYRIEWTDKIDGSRYELIRNRRFLGFEKCTWQGEQNCIKFETKEILSSRKNGTIELETIGWELYAENIGLIKRYKKLNEALELEQNLQDIISLEAFEILKK